VFILFKTRVKGDLLGVAGTDVPIAEFEKLTLPYKVSIIVQILYIKMKCCNKNRSILTVASSI